MVDVSQLPMGEDPFAIEMGGLVAEFRRDSAAGPVGMRLRPKGGPRPVARRRHLSGVAIDGYAKANRVSFPADPVEPMIQVRCRGEDYGGGFTQSRSLRNTGSANRLAFERIATGMDDSGIRVCVFFRHPAGGWQVRQELDWFRGQPWIRARTVVENTSGAPIDLELLASFSISGITPYAPDDAPGRLRLHRFRSSWSDEGRWETHTAEELGLERAWIGQGVRCERFGALGSLPVLGFHPCAAIEDAVAGVTWAAQLAVPGSWQMEFYRKHDSLSLSGGLVDREFGHWMKTIPAGGTFASPFAFLTAVCGGVDEACAALVQAQQFLLPPQPASEDGLPVIFNEWGTTWGHPSHVNMVSLARALRGSGVRYLVMDAGWYAPQGGGWSSAHGDWIPNREMYPGGLRATAEAIRAEGLIPGLWFELETCGSDSALFKKPDLLLHRDGAPITAGGRRFLDLRKPEVVDYLAERVIGTLRDGGFGYLKVDYNSTAGFGADGAESPGEGLRQHMEASQAFFDRIRRELPELVIENCASGGHRLEPSYFARTAMSSFSDAHECLGIPVIAADLHRLMLPRQSQIWAVLRPGEGDQRTSYSLAAGFLGRLCLSGDYPAAGTSQHDLVLRAIALYREIAPLIAEGHSTRFGPPVRSRVHPDGWQAVARCSPDGTRALVVLHTFAAAGVKTIQVPLAGNWRLAGSLGSGMACPGGVFTWTPAGDWCGAVAQLERIS
jgi:alpha-galactosidase